METSQDDNPPVLPEANLQEPSQTKQLDSEQPQAKNEPAIKPEPIEAAEGQRTTAPVPIELTPESNGVVLKSAEQGQQQKVEANGNAMQTLKVKQEVVMVKSLSIEELGTQNYIGIGERDDSPEPVRATDRLNGVNHRSETNGNDPSSDDKDNPEKHYLSLRNAMSDLNNFIRCDHQVCVIREALPKFKFHYLIVPKQNIRGLDELTPKHVETLKHIEEIAKEIIADPAHQGATFRFGYIAQPTMIMLQQKFLWLHMHVISDEPVLDNIQLKKQWNVLNTSLFIDSQVVRKQLEATGKVELPHVATCKELINGEMPCHKCDFKTNRVPSLKTHIQAEHLGGLPKSTKKISKQPKNPRRSSASENTATDDAAPPAEVPTPAKGKRKGRPKVKKEESESDDDQPLVKAVKTSTASRSRRNVTAKNYYEGDEDDNKPSKPNPGDLDELISAANEEHHKNSVAVANEEVETTPAKKRSRLATKKKKEEGDDASDGGFLPKQETVASPGRRRRKAIIESEGGEEDSSDDEPLTKRIKKQPEVAMPSRARRSTRN